MATLAWAQTELSWAGAGLRLTNIVNFYGAPQGPGPRAPKLLEMALNLLEEGKGMKINLIIKTVEGEGGSGKIFGQHVFITTD